MTIKGSLRVIIPIIKRFWPKINCPPKSGLEVNVLGVNKWEIFDIEDETPRKSIHTGTRRLAQKTTTMIPRRILLGRVDRSN